MLWHCDRMSKDYEEKLLEDIIETAKEEDIWVGKGGARIVVDHPYDENKVVKIAIGIGGMKQIHNEVTTYNGYADQVSLATIYGYSDLLEEMIRVQPIDGDYDLPNYNYNDDIDDDDDDDEDDVEFTTTEYTRSDFWDLVTDLNDITGETGDNEQIGLDANGNLVAYDYGFFVYNNCSHDQTSPMRNCHWTNDFLIEYLTELLEVIRGNRSIQDVEEEFINNEADEDDEDFNCDSWYNDTDMENYDPDNYCECSSREDSDYESDYNSAEDSDE